MSRKALRKLQTTSDSINFHLRVLPLLRKRRESIMLVLTRKQSEMIQIGDDIVIKVIRTGKSTVKIGIEAPAHVRVLRAELCDEGHHVPKPNASDFADVPDRMGMTLKMAAYSDQYPHVV
jgi:carbon storage regulator